ncbi:formimidoylglutamate deiminase [Streptomyces venezuelae]|uniref:Formimidoylglutamate deiminase n=1 Tax=Streptomyces venezuelae TaxID=54571 RepID=A0A5P2BT10_STRVZ|nr:formimidoylglutamate deiminase [Streptomyces venezuelae]QES31519.1 formimidoylglutamate deiminase [Streptomyces venezuelae]
MTTESSTETYWLEQAWLGTHVEPGVAVDVAGDRITAVRRGVDAPPPGATVLRGLTLPGLANAHSHAFHRALRGTVQVGSGTFWTWREVMYAVADRLTPDTYHALARAVYAEMALAGITTVGEFHYLHHAPGGTPYADPNAMGEALIQAAADAGIRITLLDTAYVASGLLDADRGKAPDRHQLRFSDGTTEKWAERASLLKDRPHARIGAAIHSVRAVPARQLGTVAQWSSARPAPLHVHLSEQTAENEACMATHGCTPTQLLSDHGVLGARTTGIHNTHLTEEDIALLGGSSTGTCMCPTTERDLADGIGPALRLQQAGSPLSLGSDSHAVIDILEEARAMELNERLRSHTRGHWTAAALLHAATADGHAALGWPDAGTLERGALADLTTITLDSVRTTGPLPRLAAETAVFAATSADVRHTVVGGAHVVRDGEHALVEDVPGALREAVAALRD